MVESDSILLLLRWRLLWRGGGGGGHTTHSLKEVWQMVYQPSFVFAKASLEL